MTRLEAILKQIPHDVDAIKPDPQPVGVCPPYFGCGGSGRVGREACHCAAGKIRQTREVEV